MLWGYLQQPVLLSAKSSKLIHHLHSARSGELLSFTEAVSYF